VLGTRKIMYRTNFVRYYLLGIGNSDQRMENRFLPIIDCIGTFKNLLLNGHQERIN
jgi:hypothetical protein